MHPYSKYKINLNYYFRKIIGRTNKYLYDISKKIGLPFVDLPKDGTQRKQIPNKSILTDDLKDKILSYDYNRIKYFDSLDLDMSPYEN